MNCNHCGNTIEPGDLFCEKCGEKITGFATAPASSSLQTNCQKCREPAESTDEFCYFCGTKLLNMSGVSPSATSSPTGFTSPTPPKSSIYTPPAATPQPQPTMYATPPTPQPQPMAYAPAAAPQLQPTTYAPTPGIAPQQTAAYAPPQAQTQPRMPLIFLLDVSASAAPYINQLNSALNRFKAEVSQDGQTQNILDVSIIQFSDNFSVLQDFTPIGNMKPVRLIASGYACYSTPIQEALRMTDEVQRYQSTYKPWIILISGSPPTDDINFIANAIQQRQQADELRFMALGYQGCNPIALKSLTDVVFRQDGDDFTSFFDWISKCMWAIAKTTPGEKPQLPPLQGSVYRDK